MESSAFPEREELRRGDPEFEEGDACESPAKRCLGDSWSSDERCGLGEENLGVASI